MRNIAIIVLSVVLAVAIISGLILYQRHRDTKHSLLISEENLSELNEKVSQLSQENSKLRDQIHKNAKRLKGLDSTQGRISELENAIRMKDQIISESEERAQGAQSHIRYLEEQIAKEHDEFEGLHRELFTLKEQKLATESKIGQLKSTREELISDLNKQIENQELTLKEFQERLQEAQSRILYLEEEIAGGQNKIEGLDRKLLALKGEKALAETKIGQLKSTYEELVCDLNKQIENQEVTLKAFEEQISVTLVDRIVFEFAKANITAEGRMILKRVGDVLKKVQGRKIRVVGHSDNIPILPEYQYKFPSNWELSAARAGAVVRYFQKNIGLDPDNLEAVGRSFYDPVASNETLEGRAQNRRVEIIIAPKIE